MKASIAIVALVFAVACGGREVESTTADESVAQVETGETGSPPAGQARTSDDPCAPLQARMVRYDTAGKPFFFSFEIPEGFTVNEIYGPDTAAADITIDLDGDGSDDYILRLAQNSRTIENIDRVVAGFRASPMTETVIEHQIDGRPMNIQRTRIGEMVGFTVLLPSTDRPSDGHMVIGGVTSAPKPCRDQAAETVERILMSFERNPRVGENPGYGN